MKYSIFLDKDDIQKILAEKFHTDTSNVKVNQYSANVMIDKEPNAEIESE